MYKAVFFDFDGVIINSEPLIRYAFSESYKEHFGQDTDPPIEKYLSYCGDSFTRIMDRLNLPHSLQHKFREISIHNMHMIETFPDVIKTLEILKKEQLKLSLITGKESSRTIKILERFDLKKYFDLIICSDMVQNPKPNPESIYKSIEYFKIESTECLMVGDSLSDIVSAQRAGIDAVAVSWGIGKLHLFEGVGTDFIIHKPEELLKIVLN